MASSRRAVHHAGWRWLHDDPATSVLLTDLYQLTMLQAYLRRAAWTDTAVFEFFVRKLPPGTQFSAWRRGSSRSLEFLEQLHFTRGRAGLAGIDTGRFSPDFLASLESLRFTGDVHAMPEGTVFFPDEPILRVTAPLPQAQLVETRLINLLHFQTLVASKAARWVLVAPGKLLVDFGLRRAHGAEAGPAGGARQLYRRASPAPRRCWPASGSAFRCSAPWRIPSSRRTTTRRWPSSTSPIAQPDNVVLLIDTYDTEAAAHKVVALAPKLTQRRHPHQGRCASTAAISPSMRAGCGASSTRAA